MLGSGQIVLTIIIGSIMVQLRVANMKLKTIFFTTLIYQFIALQPGVVTMILETLACRKIS